MSQNEAKDDSFCCITRFEKGRKFVTKNAVGIKVHCMYLTDIDMDRHDHVTVQIGPDGTYQFNAESIGKSVLVSSACELLVRVEKEGVVTQQFLIAKSKTELGLKTPFYFAVLTEQEGRVETFYKRLFTRRSNKLVKNARNSRKRKRDSLEDNNSINSSSHLYRSPFNLYSVSPVVLPQLFWPQPFTYADGQVRIVSPPTHSLLQHVQDLEEQNNQLIRCLQQMHRQIVVQYQFLLRFTDNGWS